MLLKKPGFSQLRTWESCVVCKMENQSGRYDLNLGYWRKHSSLVDWKTRWRRQQGTCRFLQFIPEEKNCLVGGLQSADFFRGDNKEGIDARNEVCMLWPSSVFICSRIGCQIGVNFTKP
jgi:hypothetical protein